MDSEACVASRHKSCVFASSVTSRQSRSQMLHCHAASTADLPNTSSIQSMQNRRERVSEKTLKQEAAV